MSDAQNGAQGAAPEPTVTPAAEFRRVREQGELITLRETGRVVRMRVVKPAMLLRLGTIPDILSELVIRVVYGAIKPEEYDAFFDLAERKEHATDFLESLRVVCTAALIEPRVVDDPQTDDEIHIDDLEDSEQKDIFDLAIKLEATGLSRFRQLQAENVEPVAPEPEPQVQAE